MSKQKFQCLCCGYLTLEDQPPGTYEICPVCFWEDDPVQARDPLYTGGANRISLEQARHAFAQMGAVAERFTQLVRRPRADEIPPSKGKHL